MTYFYQRMKVTLEDLNKSGDQEIAHVEADKALREIALDITLGKQERINLVELYDKIDKWFA